MHPAFLYWWKYGRRQPEWGDWAHCGAAAASRRREERHAAPSHHDSAFGQAFGVRRPLRFLAYKLDLSDEQVAELARVLNELKTERAQAEVDGQRTVAAFADAVEGEAFDDTRAGTGAGLRVQSAERLREAVVRALRQIHAVLDGEQRKKLAYLIRTGALAI